MLKRILCAITSPNVSLWLLGLMFLLPFINMFHQQLIPSFYAEWVAASLGLVAMLALMRKSVWQPLHMPQIAIIFPGLAAILGMQWLLGLLHSTQYALLVLSYLAWGFLLVVLGSYLRRTLGWEKLAAMLAWCLLVAGLINVGIVVLQYAMRAGVAMPWLPSLSSYGAISQPNHFADFSALATASLIYLYAKGLYAKGRFALLAFSVTLVLFLTMLAFSGSRSAWLYLTALTLLAIILQVNAMRQRTGSTAMRSLLRVSLLLLPTFVVVHLAITYVLPEHLVILPTERMAEAAISGASSPRLQLWYDSLRLFMQSPWLGVGFGAMRAESFLLLDVPAPMATKHIFEHAHNLFIHLLAEMGIGGFLIVVVGLAAWLRAFKWRELSLETWWLLALLAVLGIHSMLEYPLWFAYFLGIAAVLLGAGEEKITAVNLAQRSQKLGQDFNPNTAQSHIAARSVLAALILLGAINLSTLITANIKLESWLKNIRGNNISVQEAKLDWAHTYSLFAPYAELMYALTMQVNPSYIDDKVWLSQHVMRFRPIRRIAYQHVLLLKLQGDHANAVKQLKRTLIAHPGNFKKELEAMPFKYWQDYLDVLSEARPMPVKKKI